MLWFLLAGMSLSILALGFSSAPAAAPAGSNPAVNIIDVQFAAGQVVVVAERVGPGIVFSGTHIRFGSKEQEVPQSSCDYKRCTFATPARARHGTVQVCGVSDLLPEQDFCVQQKF